MNRFKIAIVSLALASAPIAATAVLAQQTAPSTAQPSTTQPNTPNVTNTQGVDYQQTLLKKLAAALGIDVAKLEAALKTAGSATIDEALENQDITRDQAERLRSQVQEGHFIGFGPRLGRGPGHDGFGRGGGPGGRHGGMQGMVPGGPGLPMMDRQPILEAAARALGLDVTQLESQLRSGKTLANLANEKGIAVKAVQDAMLAALKTQLEAAVKAGQLTQAQSDEILKRFQDNPNFALGRIPRI